MRKLALLPLLLLAAACSGKPEQPRLPEMARLELYNYSPSASLEDRICQIPPRLLEIYRKIDGKPGYKPYLPTQQEKALLAEYLALMPPAYGRVFREKCAGLYFVEGFTGYGVTSWVVDSEGRLYFSMILNPAALRETLSETMTNRERSCFIPESGLAVAVNAGTKYKGLAYALFHEAAHALDYIEGVTPYTDPDQPQDFRAAARPDGGLFTEAWESYSRPFPRNEFLFRDKITFYGFDGGPKIPLLDAYGAYVGLAGSPFISLYGAKSWAEDFAELTAYGLIAGKLGQPYSVRLSARGAKDRLFEPMKGTPARRAAAALALAEKL